MSTIYTLNSKVLKNIANDKWLIKKEGLPPIQANTVRVRTIDGNAPIKVTQTSYETATLVSGTTDVYDVYKSGNNFRNLLYNSTNVVEVIGANTTDIRNMFFMFYWCTSLTSVSSFDTSSVTSMQGMFYGCSAITTVPLFNTSNVTSIGTMFESCTSLIAVPLFDTSNVTSMGSMFESCTSLIAVPLFDTSNVTVMDRMFYNCTNVQSGALALYTQVSTQTTPPSSHNKTFYNCGSNTTAGAVELAQIPSDWKD